MKLKFDLFDHESEKQNLDPSLPSPERGGESERPVQVIEYVVAAPLTESERINELLQTLSCYVERERAFMHAPGLPLVYAMLGGDDIGKTVFESLDTDTKSLYLTMVKKVQDKLKEVYLSRKFHEPVSKEEMEELFRRLQERYKAGEFDEQKDQDQRR